MRIRILGGGWYGCHIALALKEDGHAVELHEVGEQLFGGASGANPARLHLGFHYPRSRLTRAACQEHYPEFMRGYGDFTRTIPVNIYAIAAKDSLVDFGTYRQVLKGEVDFIELEKPEELGLRNVEGAVLTGERHIVIGRVRRYFEEKLAAVVRFRTPPGDVPAEEFDWTIDCTFCARDAEAIDRYEPCVTGLLAGPVARAVTIMDGPFPSIYPWDPDEGLSSITSASLTPLDRCQTHAQAVEVLREATAGDLFAQVEAMRLQMAFYWPESFEMYRIAGYRTGVRAMPRSGASARLVDLVKTGPRALRIRAGKIDAVMHAERLVREALCSR